MKVDKGTLQSVPVPHVNVSNDSNAQVKVELNIANCHCPDAHVERNGGGVNPLSVPTPGVTPQPDAKVPPVRPEVRPNAHPLHRLDVTPRHDTKMPDNRATDTKLGTKVPDTKVPDTKVPDAKVPDAKVPDAKVPDTKVPDTKVPDTKVPDTKVPDTKVPDAKVPDTKVPDTKVPDAKVPDTKVPDAKVPDTKAPDAKVTPPSKAKSSGIHPGALHRLESTPLPGTTPRPDTKTLTSTDNRQKDIPDQPKPEADVTSPGPAENENDFKGWAFINRRRLGS
ncbi:titin [Pseudomonas sp. NFACC42-2]|nr:titin [Pseudomonas sp. NFACC42-2]